MNNLECRFEKKKSLLHRTMNTRDVSKTYSILRSAMITDVDQDDMQFLQNHNIRTIIDLRSEFETSQMPNALKDNPDFTYYNFPILEGSGVPNSMEEFYEFYMKICKNHQMKDIFRIIANADNGVIYHCTAGKDRTGVTSAVLQMLAGDSDERIIADYVLTGELIQPLISKIQNEHPGINIEFVIPKRDMMERFLHDFRKEFGTAEEYLKDQGLTDQEITMLKKKLQ